MLRHEKLSKGKGGNEPQLDEARAFADRSVRGALSMGGTCTGEHGIGFGKLKYLYQEHGGALDVMRFIKATLDPENRMNRGKIIDVSSSREEP